jgi:peptidoglycan/xylan/chitin deacetylase (PgdA/CDA1 family)
MTKYRNKRVKALVVIIFSFISLSSSGQRKNVCFSFDDLPLISYNITDSIMQKGLVTNLINSLLKNRIPAIGFVNENKLYENKRLNLSKVDLLKMWINNGLDLGNHTFSHPDYNTVSYNEYTRDILKGEKISKEITGHRNMSIKYFRHPYLHMGNSKEKADSLNAFLSGHGYTVAPVTIDNEDYIFASAYEKSKVNKDTALMKQIGNDYIIYMEKKLKYFEKQAIKLFGRNINQILLLHASFLNSDYLDSLAGMFQKNNYDFISMDKTLEDDVYKTEITKFGNWGISWIDRWALSAGKKGDFFEGEPVTPDYIVRLSK